jgi:hypothetical protein
LMIVLVGLRLRRLHRFLRLHGELVQSHCSALPLSEIVVSPGTPAGCRRAAP